MTLPVLLVLWIASVILLIAVRRRRGVEGSGLDVLVPREGVRVCTAIEQKARRLDVAEEAREPEWLEAVVAEGIRLGGVFVEQLPEALGAPEGRCLEDVQFRLARE